MKQDIHPKYNAAATITCACGNTMSIGSTLDTMNVELCSACHPFYTGQQKLVDTAGRVEKFKERFAKKEALSGARKGKAAKKAARSKTQSDTVTADEVKKAVAEAAPETKTDSDK